MNCARQQGTESINCLSASEPGAIYPSLFISSLSDSAISVAHTIHLYPCLPSHTSGVIVHTSCKYVSKLLLFGLSVFFVCVCKCNSFIFVVINQNLTNTVKHNLMKMSIIIKYYLIKYNIQQGGNWSSVSFDDFFLLNFGVFISSFIITQWQPPHSLLTQPDSQWETCFFQVYHVEVVGVILVMWDTQYFPSFHLNAVSVGHCGKDWQNTE